MNTIYTLMIKTHCKTGLKYLCQTTRDPFKYNGSGVDWTPHLREYGTEHETEILLQTEIWQEMADTGRYYSAYYNIVTGCDDFGNKIWANRIIECGGGGGASCGDSNPMKDEENKKKIRGDKNGMTKPEAKEKISGSKHYSKQPDYKDELFGGIHPSTLPEVMAKKSGDNHYSKRPDYKDELFGGIQPTPPSGKNHYLHDDTIHTWYHKDTGQILKMTQNEFVRTHAVLQPNVSKMLHGQRKSVSGWRVIFDAEKQHS
jgi:hypothetical protein